MSVQISLCELEYLVANKASVKIDSPTGYINITNTYRKRGEGYELKFTDGTSIKAAKNHKIFCDNSWTECRDFVPYDVIDNKIIESIIPVSHQEWVDFSVDADHESYFHNGMVHHNSGKSLLIYSIVRYLLGAGKVNRVLLIFPSISLVTQMYSDFEDYSSANGWETGKHCHKVFSGQEKDDPSKSIVMSTYQSIYKLGPAYFSKFDMIISDECHLVVGKSLTGIYEKCHNVEYRYGFTGSLQSSKAHKLVIEGLTGKAYTTTTTSDLMKDKYVAQLKIKCLLLSYPEATRKIFNGTEYADEMKYLCSYTKRNEFISKLAFSLEGNTLLLFTYISHGKILVDMLKEMGKEEVYFIHGNIKADIREHTRKIIETSENAIIVASYGVFSTGISIKKLNNLILGSPYKSKVKILQSTGRVLRLAENKTDCTMYDIADDISWKASKNHTLKHMEARIELYASQKFDYRIIDCPLK